MHSLFFTPKKGFQQDDHWGQSVVSLVNSALGLEMEYLSPTPLTCQCQDFKGAQHAEIEAVDKLHAFRSSYKRFDHPKDRIKTRESRAGKPHGVIDSISCSGRQDSQFEFPNEQVHRKQLSTLREKDAQTSNAHPVGQIGPNSLRMPDFFKRVFAPPVCLQPDVNHFDSTNHLWTTKSMIGNDKQASLPYSSSSYPRIEPKTSRPFVPWASVNTEGVTRPVPTSQVAPYSGLREWESGSETQHTQRNSTVQSEHRTTNADMQDSLVYNKHVLDQSGSCYSSIISGGSSICKSHGQIHNSTLAPRPRKTSLDHQSVSDSEGKIDKDIKAFLDSPLQIHPFNARHILDLCEAAELADNNDTLRDKAEATDRETEANYKRRSETLFQPRRAIGKTGVY
ncbi:protein of unknown function [Taphrina deformans PYCC 5710]|uniref:Uncharacterized protein n=1 Tax=Taphrina deformans (strain PYCC 5710 / ATCC 11124 / CBS 356.35 / IMI 108563 / JCM 9778 / NBRC 8474) TaxID=1097556 RepID=R4ZYM7_TAPDE|nr:protein of unknown function [Taphrina deformans PYCC 5710]|eukprot:CCX35431.1 protein of unknown function [Taphrina deformans PYCC 5710]